MSEKTIAEVDKGETVKKENSKIAVPSNFYSRISLFERIGGQNTIDAIVEIMILKVLADPRIRDFFVNADLDKMRNQQKEFFATLFGVNRKKSKLKDFFSHPFGGKKPYDLKRLGPAHAPLVAKGLSGNHFDAMMDIFFKTLVELKIPNALMKEAITAVASTRFVILGNGNKEEESESPQTQVHEVSPVAGPVVGPVAEEAPAADSTVPEAESKDIPEIEVLEVLEEDDDNDDTVCKPILKTQKADPETHQADPSGKSTEGRALFDRIGGHEALGGVVDMWLKNAVEDNQLQLFFHGVNLPRLHAKMKAFMTMALGGPSKYNDGTLGDVHSKLRDNGLTGAHINAMRDHLEHALREQKVPESLIRQILKIVESKRAVILGKSSSYSIEEGVASFDNALTNVVNMEAGYMKLLKDKKRLIKKNQKLSNDISQLESKIKLMEDEKINAEAEKAALAGEIDLLKKEQDHHAEKRRLIESVNQRLESEKECLENDKDFLGGEKERVLRENEQLVNEKHELASRAERMFNLLESLPSNVIFCDEDLNVLFMNAASYQAFESIEDLLPLSPDKMPCQSLEILHEEIETQRSFLMNPKNLPHMLNLQLGPEYLDFSFHPLHSKDESGKGVVVTWEVVTERFKQDQGQKVMKEELKNVLAEVQTCCDSLADMADESAVASEASPRAGSHDMGFNLDPILCDPQNLPHRTRLKMGEEILELCLSPVYDGNGIYRGPQVTWEVVTRRIEAEQREKMAIENMQHVLTQVCLNSEILNTTSEKLLSLSGNMSRGLENISSLAKEVVKEVSSIATQAQLAALNTSIDAVWAENSGDKETFGSELIQRLANHTTRATEDIHRLIKDIQFKTCEIVDSTQKEVQEVSHKISEVGRVITTTLESHSLTSDEILQAADNSSPAQLSPLQKAGKDQENPQVPEAEPRQADILGKQLTVMTKRLEALVLRFQGQEPANGDGNTR